MKPADVTLLVLSGGKSTRFWPLPHKMIMRVGEKTFLERQLEALQAHNFGRVILVVNEEISGRISGDKLEVVVQKGKGQAAAILSAREKITNGPLLIVNADDVVAPQLYGDIVAAANARTNILTGYQTEDYFPGGYLIVHDKKVAQIVEKPKPGQEPSNYVRLVCDFFGDSTLLLAALDKHVGKFADDQYESALSWMMNNGNEFELFEYNNTWIPVKYPWHLLNLMDYYLGQIKKTVHPTSTRIHKSASIVGPVVFGTSVRVMEYAKIVGPCYIGDGAIIGNHTMVRQSMIGDNTVIGFGSDVTRSYIGANTWLHSNYVGDSVLADNVALGAGSVLANLRLDEGNIASIVNNVKVSTLRDKLGAIIGEGARIGVESNLMPGVKVGANSVVGPSVVLFEDIADNTRVFVKQSFVVEDNHLSNIHDRDKFRQKI